MKNNRWIISRIGLINFWYYDEEEFDFAEGRLLLRGANGAGKSVTMQSFIPLLLDGNKSPERLDPFGSRARKLENYLLGEDDTGEQERTGYLYMEFKKPQSGQYLTLGMGLYAKRGRPLDFWGFGITDGRRVGRDFHLVKRTGEKIPLTKQELKNRIGEGGEVHERQKDYMAMVNRLLFGYDQLEEYDELIKLLVQLRTPKLSKEFKPTVIYDILTNSLQPLSDEDLRPMSEAIENMDNIKSRLDQLQESKKAADRLGREFDKYNAYLLWEKAGKYLESAADVAKGEAEEKRLEAAVEEYIQLQQEAEARLTYLKSEQEALEIKQRELMQHDAYRIAEELKKHKTDLEEWKKEKEQKNGALQQKEERERKIRSELTKAGNDLELLEKRLADILTELTAMAEETRFDEHFFILGDFPKNPAAAVDWQPLKKELQRYRELIRRILAKFREEEERNRAYDQAYGELEEAKKERETARLTMERAEQLLFEIKEEFIEKVYAWRQANQLLVLPEAEMVHLQRMVNNYPENSYDDFMAVVRAARDELEKERLSVISGLSAAKDSRAEQLQAKEAELADWLHRKEPEPARSEEVLRNRARLKEAGVPFIPFYQAVDYRPEVSEELRGKIEEALANMGVLDALLIPAQYRERLGASEKGTADRYLFPKFQLMTADLANWLQPAVNGNAPVSPEEVDLILRSIMIEETEALLYLTEEGRFGVGGVLKGEVSAVYQSKYIGVEARRRYREEVIAGLRGEIADLKAEIMRIDQEIQAQEEKGRQLAAEYAAFPGKEDLEAAFATWRDTQLTLANKEKEVVEKSARAETCYQRLKQTREEIRELTVRVQLPVNLAAFIEAEKRIEDYADALRELETSHTKYLAQRGYLASLEEHLAEIEADLDDLRYDLGRLNRLINREEQVICNLQETLDKTDYQSIKKEIEACLARVAVIPREREEAAAQSRLGQEKAADTRVKLADLRRKIYFLRALAGIRRAGFMNEYNLGYVAIGSVREDPLALAKRIREEYKDYKNDAKTREDYLSTLQRHYFEVRPQLTEYRLSLEYLFDLAVSDEGSPGAPTAWNRQALAGEWLGRMGSGAPEAGGEEDGMDGTGSRPSSKYLLDGEMTDEEHAALIQARAEWKRLDIRGRIQGRDVNFPTLAGFLTDSIAENEKLLRESDRQLFEDILANTISKKIRAKIYHSEQWVEKMNRLMAAMNTSSGLTFSLAWKSRAAETEEQMDTAELVGLLKSDAHLLRSEDFQRLAEHFRSKINQARKGLEEAGVTKTFHALVKEVLDYRQWFEFQLFYTKTGERKREMTNNAFDRLSGGEKAMGMYVPLFSAVYARYEAARPDAPRLISLDEAFAGVDENNIRDMFRLLEELELNFIMNSQILWGDYDTVPALSICELVRPNNANYVSVIRYRWNGQVRELVTKEAIKAERETMAKPAV